MNSRKRKLIMIDDSSFDSDDSLNDFIVKDDYISTDDTSMDDIIDDITMDDISMDEILYKKRKCDRNCEICKIDKGHNIENVFTKDIYFKSLDKEQKINYIKIQSNIDEYNKQIIPLKYRMLSSNIDLKTKSIILFRIDEFENLSQDSSEYGKMKKWIDGIANIPFDRYINLPIEVDSSDCDKYNFLCHVNMILNKSIYGQLDAKNKILQMVSQWMSNPESKGNVIALQGPPGIGKTTLIKNGLSNALNIPFCFVALGGASDASILEGHSFTYEGSTWGKIVDIIMQTKCMNPIIFFDELDKVSKSEKGQEIINSLMHLTDKSQNDKFHDVYFGLDFDMSRATFIFSCNDDKEIDYILNDRIEYIRLKGFRLKEKIEIAKNYMIPDILRSVGLFANDVLINNDNLEYIIKNYTKEEGVRKLREYLDQIYSRINLLRYVKNRKDIEIGYSIDKFKLPIKLNNNLIKKLLS